MTIHVSFQKARILRVSNNFGLYSIDIAGVLTLMMTMILDRRMRSHRRRILVPMAVTLRSPRFSFHNRLVLLPIGLIVIVAGLEMEATHRRRLQVVTRSAALPPVRRRENRATVQKASAASPGICVLTHLMTVIRHNLGIEARV